MGQRRQVLMPTTSKDQAGVFAWVFVTTVVVVFDAWALAANRQTMSAAFLNAARKPGFREMLVVVWGALTWHLFGGRPDPLRKLVG